MSDKPHPATEKRRQEFREKGSVPRSRDLSAVFVMLAGALAIMFTLPLGLRHFVSACRHSLGRLGPPDATLGYELLASIAAMALPVASVGCIAALLAGWLQAGVHFVPLKLDPTRINPPEKLKELLLSKEAWATVALSLLKVVLLGSVFAWSLVEAVRGTATHDAWSVRAALAFASDSLVPHLGRAGVVMLGLGLLDYAWNRYRLEQRMRMDDQELKDERKQEQGDPQMKQRRRKKALELAKSRSTADVPSADVVVVNPTHFAVALAYSPERMSAPRVVGKGTEQRAEEIRRIARAHDIPIERQPPLARALFRRVSVGKEIPSDLYQAVAVVLAAVYRRRRPA